MTTPSTRKSSRRPLIRLLPALTPALIATALHAQSNPPPLPLASASPLPGAATPASAPTSRIDPRNGFAETLRPTKKRTTAKPGLIENVPYAPIQPTDDEAPIPEIEMFVGESRVFPAPGVARIAVGNGSILTAAALDGKEVILFANATGTSSLFIWNADGRYQRVKINIVPGDAARHVREVAAFLSTIPKAKASVVGTSIIVEGDELSDADLLKIEELAKRYPQIVNFTNKVGWEQMVSFDVKVVEFPTSALKEIGLKWNSTGGAGIAGIWAPIRRGNDGPYQLNIQTGQNNAPPITSPGGQQAVPMPSGLNALGALNMGLNAQLNLLAQDGRAAVLAEPQLSARNGAKASFVAGGEIPYAVTNRDGVYVQFKTYGVKLNLTPKVDRHGVIRATVHAEVSSIDSSVSTAAGPALLSRQTETEFNVRNGETIVLSGLLQRDQSTSIDKVPLLGDIPVLGALFRSKRFQNKETELVVFITPTLVDAQSPANVERVQRATERLEARLGPSPHVSQPLEPAAQYGPVKEAGLIREARPASTAASAPSSTPSPASPPAHPNPPQSPQTVRSAAHGKPASPVSNSDAKAPPVPLPLTLPPAGAGAYQYRVRPRTLAMRLTPEVNASVVAQLHQGDIVLGLLVLPQGKWTAVEHRQGDQVQRGWVTTQWLVQVEPN